MKNKLFSRGIYTEGLRRLRVFGLILAAVGLLAEIAPPMVTKMEHARYASNEVFVSDTPIATGFFGACYMLPAIVLFVVPLLTLILFSSFNRRAYCDFCHSLPYNRNCIFISNVAAVMTWTLGLMVLCGVSGILIRLAMPDYFALNFTGYGMYILTEILTALYVCFTVTLAASLTGTVFSNITLAALIFTFPRIMVWLVTQQINDNVPLLCGNRYTPILSPRYNPVAALFSNTFDADQTLNSWGPIIYAAVICVLYAGLSLLFFNKRKSEMAGQSAPGRKTQAVVRISLTMIPSAFGTLLVLNNEVALGIVMYLLSLIVYFAYEILSTLKWRNLLRSMPSLAAVVILNFVLVGAIYGGTAIAKSYRPDAESIDSIRIMETRDEYSREGYPDNAISKVTITDNEVIRLLTDTLKNNLDYYEKRGYSPYVDPEDYLNLQNIVSSSGGPGFTSAGKNNISFTTVTVAFKNGLFTRYRSLALTQDEFNTVTERLSKNESYRDAVMTLPEPVVGTLSISSIDTDYSDQEELLDVLETFRKEIREIGFEKWYSYLVFGNDFFGDYNGVTLAYNAQTHGNYEVIITINSEDFPKTFEKIRELSWNKVKEDKEFCEAVEQLPVRDDEEEQCCWWGISAVAYVTDGDNGETNQLCMNAYSTTPDDKFYDSNMENTEALVKLFREALNSDADFSSDTLLYIDFNIEDGDNSYYKSFYLPVPEDYDFASLGFEKADMEKY